MSKLNVRARGLGRSFDLNCLQFNSPLIATIGSQQTREVQRHFPVKVNQAEINFLVQFPNEREFEDFQDFVRLTQKQGLINDRFPGVVLWWPERNIRNWTGVIRSFKAGGMRFNPAPRATFSVSLIDSSVSKRSYISSWGGDWKSITGIDLPAGIVDVADNLFDAMGFLGDAARGLLNQVNNGGIGNNIGNVLQGSVNGGIGNNIGNGNLGLPEGVLGQGGGG